MNGIKLISTATLLVLGAFSLFLVLDLNLGGAVQLRAVDASSAGDSSLKVVTTDTNTAKGRVYPKPTLAPGPYTVRSIEHGCDFTGCPAAPYVYIMTVYRNRGANYNRWLRSLVRDVSSKGSKLDLACICSVVADFNDVERGPTLDAALEDWPASKLIIHLEGYFMKASGYQALFNMGIVTPRDESIAFFMDADMVGFPGMMNDILHMTRKGQRSYAPIVWNTHEHGQLAEKRIAEAAARRAKGIPLTPKEVESDLGKKYAGDWRVGGTGMMSFYISDFDRQLNSSLPMVNRGSYGEEDTALEVAFIKSGKALGNDFTCWRKCSPDLWHFYHIKFSWSDSSDGLVKGKYTGPNPWDPTDKNWKLELPDTDALDWIKRTHQTRSSRCTKFRSLFANFYLWEPTDSQ